MDGKNRNFHRNKRLLHIFLGLLEKKMQLFVPFEGCVVTSAMWLNCCISLLINLLDELLNVRAFQFQLFQLFFKGVPFLILLYNYLYIN